jgi:hypothetical protein
MPLRLAVTPEAINCPHAVTTFVGRYGLPMNTLLGTARA